MQAPWGIAPGRCLSRHGAEEVAPVIVKSQSSKSAGLALFAGLGPEN